jgi:hypothetical protein
MGTMSPDQTEAVAHRWHIEVVQAGKLDVADEILAPDCVLHVNGQEMRGGRRGQATGQRDPDGLP